MRFFSSFGVLKLPHCKSILYVRGRWGKIRQCWCSCWIIYCPIDGNSTKNIWNQCVWQQCGFDLLKAQLLQWKRATSSQHDEPTHKNHLKPVCLAIARLRPNESTALAMKESHLFPTWWANPQKPLKPVCLAVARLRPNESTGRERSTSIQASCVPPPGCKTHPPGIKPGPRDSKPILHHYATGACPKWQEKAL